MRMSIILPVAAALAAVAIGMSSPAAATTLSQAVELCKKNPDCTIGPRAAGWTNIKVGTNEIVCPDKGECECLACKPPQRTQDANNGTVFGGSGVATQGSNKPYGSSGVGGVLTQTPAKPSGGLGVGGVLLNSTGSGQSKPFSQQVSKPKQAAESKPGANGGPKPAPTAESKPAAPAAPRIVRDNRGANGGVTVTDSRPRYDGVSNRREDKPKINDHRSGTAKDRSSAGVSNSACGKAGTPPCRVQ